MKSDGGEGGLIRRFHGENGLIVSWPRDVCESTGFGI